MTSSEEIAYLKAELKREKERHSSTKLVLEEALDKLDIQDARIVELEKTVRSLLILLNKSQKKSTTKNSRNSNLPPSSDLDRSKRKKKKKSNKKSGGQTGHQGHNLKMNDKPTKRIPLIPKACTNCGKSLDDKLKTLCSSRQEIDIPAVSLIIKQFDAYKIQCDCGTCSFGKFPERLKTKVQYGPRFRAFVNYMHVYQFVPYRRIQQFSKVIFGIHFSQGTIFNTLKRTAESCQGLYDFIKQYLASANLVGADETVVWVEQVKYYNWVWQNQFATFITCEKNRRKDNIYKYFPHGFPNAILVSDRFAAHLSTPAAGYQICWAHLLRKINHIIDSENNYWIHKLLRIYQRAKILEKIKPVWLHSDKKIRRLENDLNRLLLHEINGDLFPETKILLNGLKNKYRHALLTFLYHENVPSHNNASERAIRNAKVKLKISGHFKSAQNYYAVIRSIIDTLIKNGKNVFDTLVLIESGKNVSLGIQQTTE